MSLMAPVKTEMVGVEMSMDAVLVADSLRYAYRGVPAATDISFTLAQGSITALIGANGAGKTTSVKMLAGALLPDGGRILYDGNDVTRLPAHEVVELGVTLVPEGRLVFPALTVRENLQIGATARRASADLDRNMERTFDLFPRLAERRDQYAGTMSGGEQQMLAIGRGLMANPRVLILDEPSLGLSPKIVAQIFALVKRLNGEGISILLVEQNVNQALAIAQFAFVLEKGRVVKSGSGAALMKDPAVREAFLGGL
ncbi:MAG: ABC transporter ATP-binding protein [Hyphomicrobiales bacterium]|jgi:branched-chain amino acid transport system ATP-binding protein|nr:ABC transporter ATP-binding protein [Hyphomicrobiales bacterium]